MSTQLSAFDLVPVTSGSSASTAVSNSLDFAVQVEQFGYERLWYGEHHLNPGVIGYSPALMIALAGGVTKTIRLGAGAVLAGHRTALSVAEEFGLLEAAFPGRIDMGLGRAGLRSPGNQQDAQTVAAESDSFSNIAESHRTEHGVVIPASPDLSSLFNSPRFRIQRQLLNQPGAQPGTYDEFIADLLDLLINRKVVDGYELAGTVPVQVNPEVWVLGSSAGESSQIAGARGLRFGANYHVAPAKVLEAVADYRRAFKPNAQLAEPYVIVSAEVLVPIRKNKPNGWLRDMTCGYTRSALVRAQSITPHQMRLRPLRFLKRTGRLWLTGSAHGLWAPLSKSWLSWSLCAKPLTPMNCSLAPLPMTTPRGCAVSNC